MSNSPFGAAKNPPWARGAMPGSGHQPLQGLQNQMLGGLAQPSLVQYQQPQQVFAQNIGMQQQNLSLQMQAQTLSGQLSQGQMYSQMGPISYPLPRAVNNAAFQAVSTNATVPPAGAQSTKQRVFTGTVTKVHNDFGFVDEEVFFQTSACVKGSNPTVGDRVLVEASYNPNMPFKWNATRIQVLSINNNSGNRRESGSQNNKNFTSGNTYNAVPPPIEGQNGNFSSSRNSRKSNAGPQRREKDRREKEERHREADVDDERRRRREERERERVARGKEREEKDKSSPARRRTRSPKSRRRSRPVPRYMVQIPKIALDLPAADVLEIRRRYSNMYIPSDFFNTQIRWVDAFPPNMPFTLNQPCAFHVMHKDVDPVVENDTIAEPADADYIFSAKVMLMSMPTMEDVYRKCCSMAEEKDRERDSEERDFIHPTRLLNFLVGLRGKNETMAVGGPWSPSLDGPNPEKDPAVLIRTAIRTCKALTGINLTNCTQWYRFVELYYRRGETTHKGRVVPARVETVVIFLPDVWSCSPTRLEYDELNHLYMKQLDSILKADQDSGDDSISPVEKDDALNSNEPKKEPTHFSELDPKTMKVTDLRQELDARSLSSKGLKSQLIARLVKAIKAEADKVDQEDDETLNQETPAAEEPDAVDPVKAELKDIKEEDRKKKDDDEVRKADEKERAQLEKRYTLPESPQIIVHPSRVAKSGKFDCTVMSLSLLLDYRPEDTKEHSFEVSLFAELFNEMLMRDFGFNIYKSLHDLPEKPKDEKEERKKDKDEKKKDDKDEKLKTDKDKRSEERDKRSDDKNDKRENKDESRKDDKKVDFKKDDKRDDSKREEKRAVSESKREDTRKDDKKHENDEEDDFEDGEYDKRSNSDKNKDKNKKERVKLVTKDPHLLLSFVYFDQSHCGYIFEKDMEELLYTLGLNLSSAQVRKLVGKVVTRDSFHYRKLTDKPKDEEIKTITDTTDTVNNASDFSNKADLKALAFGNKRLLPVFETDDGPLSKRQKREHVGSENDVPDGFVMYKGGLLDVEKLMAQLKRSEKAREDTESHLVELKHKNISLTDDNARASNNIKELTEKVSDYKRKLYRCEDNLKLVTEKYDRYNFLVQDMHNMMVPFLDIKTNCSELKVEEMEIISMTEPDESDSPPIKDE